MGCGVGAFPAAAQGIRNRHRVLLRLGRKLIGPPDPAIESALTAIQDVERLERMTEAILTGKSWEELIATA